MLRYFKKNIDRYAYWLHTKWPSGKIEKRPFVSEDGSTNIRGLYIVGDLTGVSLLKTSLHSGTETVRTIVNRLPQLKNNKKNSKLFDLVIVGGGISGMAAAVEAKKKCLNFAVLESSEAFSTIKNFPVKKPIFTYPTSMKPSGDIQIKASIKEELIDELTQQIEKHGIEYLNCKVEQVNKKNNYFEIDIKNKKPISSKYVILAIGNSGCFRKLNIQGETLDKVSNRLHDPKDFRGQDVLVVGGGDSALETAIALENSGSNVSLSYRKPTFTRAKKDNITIINKLLHEKKISVYMSSKIISIEKEHFILSDVQDQTKKIKNQSVFLMLGREPPLDFLRRSGISIQGDWNIKTFVSFFLSIIFFIALYSWKDRTLKTFFIKKEWFPFNLEHFFASLNTHLFNDPKTLLGTLRITLNEPSFFYSCVYTFIMIIFGYRRIKRRKTSYVKIQTLSLLSFQIVPLFLLPYIILPYLGYNGYFKEGFGHDFADIFFPVTELGHGREYWRAFGFILAWPLFLWNFFTNEPLWGWLIVGVIQTFVIIPLLVLKWGKGAYCSFICSCGGMAETLGDTEREKMPHGKIWNQLNMIGQFFLALAFLLLFTRIIAWTFPTSTLGKIMGSFHYGLLSSWGIFSYQFIVDFIFAGVIGLGVYFWFSGRVWCRFACPLAALMNIYARFSRFRIFSEKKKCISCNICTRMCHQGIDVMSFANKGLPMQDPQCVRCSACVQSCPTGTLTFGEIHKKSNHIFYDRIIASPVHSNEKSKT